MKFCHGWYYRTRRQRKFVLSGHLRGCRRERDQPVKRENFHGRNDAESYILLFPRKKRDGNESRDADNTSVKKETRKGTKNVKKKRCVLHFDIIYDLPISAERR